MFLFRKLEKDPLIIQRKDLHENKFVYSVKVAEGAYYRVIPSNMREINFIRLLQKHADYEVPAQGDGLLVASRVLPLPIKENETRKTSQNP
jgi:hypothetical protein